MGAFEMCKASTTSPVQLLNNYLWSLGQAKNTGVRFPNLSSEEDSNSSPFMYFHMHLRDALRPIVV